MHITKEGDPFLRQLLVQSAHYPPQADGGGSPRLKEKSETT